MHRRIVSLVLAALVLAGFSACSGGSEGPAAPIATATETVAADTDPVVETPDGDATQASPEPESTDQAQQRDPGLQACLDISNKLMVAYAEMAEIMDAAEGNDMQATVDMYTELVDALGEIAETTSSADLKEAALAAQADFAAIRDGLKQVYIDDDMSGLSELTEAMVSMQTTYPALLALCGP